MNIGILIAVFVVIFIFRMIRVVPQQEAFVVERLGKFYATLPAGMHIIIPFVDRVAYKHSMKELVLDIPEQICITKDNVQVHIDGILFFRIMDAQHASYGVSNYYMALTQLAQTTLRSEIGKIDLDRTFEEREKVNGHVVAAIDKASDPWGVKVLRYEIKSITPPKDVLAAMEKQMRAEREKRALILESEGERDAKINRAEGMKQEAIKNSEAFRQSQINEAEGQASAIKSIAEATASGIDSVAKSLSSASGMDAAKLKLAEEYIKQFGHMAKVNNTMIVPSSVTDVAGVVASAMAVLAGTSQKGSPAPKQ